ncbi:PQQ-dependent sugar dehydrogenase [Chachezhania antarctica]|uniref:PQQ-dependent sugar dehydrogenase n=1 Tax=Chachezhania antarctica TaxID=2340860 RepID=UPI000EB28D4B|nr:PQQ-dependent sugar dehydrogenase [Chachezhania antarctica]|tara:strand:+ start:4294 stop:5388 length:1095 start_codon:yes stop_codon:yes gene_type:complete
MRATLIAILVTFAAWPALAETVSVSAGEVRIDPVLTGLDAPWAIGILPDGTYLVTERGGDLLYVKGGEARKVRGVPRVKASGQGGLLDIAIPRDFDRTREIFLTYSKPQPQGAGTALAVARLSPDGQRLDDVRTLFEAAPVGRTTRHFGSRVVEARDGTLFVTIGERGDRPSAQDRSNHNGTVIRINRDGSVPADNPFTGQQGIQPEIWSYGHRNPQGAALDLQGRLWVAEHGAKGGDEVNRIRKGANYGWPVISYGTHYSGQKIGEGTSKPGMEQPAFYWDPSMAPSGMMIYSGKLWPEWRGDGFVGSLKFDYIARLEAGSMHEAEQIEAGATGRVRDIVEAPDGAIWFLSVGEGAVYRMIPG